MSDLRPALVELLEATRVGHVYGRLQSKFRRGPAGDIKVTPQVDELFWLRMACKAVVSSAGTYLVIPTALGITTSDEYRNGAGR